MSIPSFQRFDYLLRANKAIERKLVFDVIMLAKNALAISDFWYLGFGSMWFGDFKIAHRLLNIDDMISIEREDHADRADFNKPFSTISVVPGDCNEILKSSISQNLWSRPVVAWLDYDGRLDDSVVNDIEVVVGKAQRNSIFLITVNGGRGTYRPRPQSVAPGMPTTGLGVVAGFLGQSSIPKEEISKLLSSHPEDILEKDFPRFLGQSILNHIWHKTSSLSREDQDGLIGFQPLFLMHHRDGADMVTVGGAIISESDRDRWQSLLKKHDALCDENADVKYCVMDLVPVTLKEKIVLDRQLPDSRGDAEYVESIKQAGVRLPAGEVEKYRKFYRQFPVFIEANY